MIRFTSRASLAAAAALAALWIGAPAHAAKKSTWGFLCSQETSTDAKKSCCLSQQTDCNAECMGNYTGAALTTCHNLCNQKGDQCRGEIQELKVHPELSPKVKEMQRMQ
jgi:hypothetical protein